MGALLSILALYNYDETIFDTIVLPVGLDKETIVDNIIMECGELEIIYASPMFMKFAISAWSKKQQGVWTKMLASVNFDYNPLFNFSRTDRLTDTETRNLKRKTIQKNVLSGEDTENRDLHGTSSGQNSKTTTNNLAHTDNGTLVNNGKDTNATSKAAFNEVTPAFSDQVEMIKGSGNVTTSTQTDTGTSGDALTNDETTTDKGDITHTKNDTTDITGNDADTGTVTTTHESKGEGTIGVITTQDMIEKERKISIFNIYDFIISDFKNRFCIMVW